MCSVNSNRRRTVIWHRY